MIWLLFVIALWDPCLVHSQKRMGFIHLGHEVIINEPLIAGSQHLWVLSASEVRQNDLCTSHDGHLVLEWWARTQQPASSLGRVSLLVYLDATSKEVHSGGLEGPMDRGGLAFDISGIRGSVVQRTVQRGDFFLNKTRVVIIISNTNLNQSSSDPVGYTMLASCLSSSMLKCPRGGSGFRPCTGMGSHYNGSCILNVGDPALSQCSCKPNVSREDCVPMTDSSITRYAACHAPYFSHRLSRSNSNNDHWQCGGCPTSCQRGFCSIMFFKWLPSDCVLQKQGCGCCLRCMSGIDVELIH